MSHDRPRVGVTLGDPRGIGPEVVAGALARTDVASAADFLVLGPEPLLPELEGGAAVERESVGRWDPDASDPRALAGRLSGRAIERAIDLARAGEIHGLVTAPISKDALSAAGYPFPGHTEFLRDRTDAEEVTMMMAAETTPLGGPLRMAFLTGHVPLREVADRLTRALALARSRIAVRALRDWWGIDRPRLAFAGLNPHASEGGLFGDEEERVLGPTAEQLADEEEVEVHGIFPADTVFRRCLDERVDAVVVPYHDVGLAVLKTIARETGVNVTAGLPFPRTSPDHGTALDIAGKGVADPSSMAAAMRLCIRFCGRQPEVCSAA